MKPDLKSFTEGLEKWLRLRALSVLPKDPTSISGIHAAVSYATPVWEILMPSLSYEGTKHSCGT